MTNILFDFDHICIHHKDSGSMHPVRGAIETLKQLDENGYGLAISIKYDESNQPITKCGVPLPDVLKWLNGYDVHNFNVGVTNPTTLENVVTLHTIFDGRSIPYTTYKTYGEPLLNRLSLDGVVSWGHIREKLVDKGYITFKEF